MPDPGFAERTEPATPHKRREARERGQVAKSQDLVTAMVLLAVFAAFALWGDRAIETLSRGTRAVFATVDARELDATMAVALGGELVAFGASAVAPLLAAAFAAAFLGNVIQVGFLASGEALTPDLGRINPIRGFGRIFSWRGVFRSLTGVLKVLAIGTALWLVLRTLFDAGSSRNPLALMGTTPLGATVFARESIVRLGISASLVLLVIALADVSFQRWQHERDLRMTKQEVREELKRMEGDPKIRERRRRAMHRIMRSRMIHDTRKADVVITNPTEVAVAIAYDEARDAAPRVLAKGDGFLAERIRRIAYEAGIPVVQRPPLARALFGAVEVGAQIPPAFYRAVAEVLAYVWKASGRARPAGA